MSRKIELLLQLAADYQDFCAEPKFSAITPRFEENELAEFELDLIAAAAKPFEDYVDNNINENK